MKYRLYRLAWGRRMTGPLIFVVLLMAAFMVVSTGPTAEPAEPAERVWPVSVMEAEPASLHPVHRAWGRLESAQTAAIRSRVTSTVESVRVSEGDWVEAGEVLVELETEEVELSLRAARAARDRAEASLASARGEYELARELAVHHERQNEIAQNRLQRFETLHRDRMISDAQFDDMRQQAGEQAMVLAQQRARVADMPNLIARREAELAEAGAALQQARHDRDHATILAPFSGRILEMQVARGDRALAGDVLARVADYDQLRLRVSVSGEVAERLRHARDRAGPEAAVSARTTSGEVMRRFSLEQLAATVRSGQSGIDAFFKAPADPGLVIGELYGLEIDLPARDDVIALPVHALYEGGRVYRVKDGRLQAVAVRRVGDYEDEQGAYRVLVASPDISAGDTLMTTQLPVAISGLRVDPVNQPAGDLPATRELAVN
ncbi:MAG: HlyD family efflux transporter periplasmic adaptor subunit [Pseudohongiellaceae bacterium]